MQREDGSWRVITNQGEIIAEHVVTAAAFGREGRMVGLDAVAPWSICTSSPGRQEVMDFNRSAAGADAPSISTAKSICARNARAVVGT